MRLIQIKKGKVRRVALVEEPYLRLLDGCSSIYALANVALAADMTMTDLIRQRDRHERLEYDPIYNGRSEWRILPAIDHPEEPARCLVSGTGLTHLGSAQNRQSMHEARPEELTDSMKMFRWGVEGGRPSAGRAGTPPEWFYKGTGTTVRGHGESLDIPSHAEDGGEEAEIAGVYVIAPDGQPCRIGMATGNEFSDHQFGKKNYLNLAGSKLRTCALGPELVVDPDFQSVQVAIKIERNGFSRWRAVESQCHRLACNRALCRSPMQAQEVNAQSSFYSANDRRLHFGLVNATTADLTIRWTNGATETIPNVAADQLVTIREGAGIIRREKFK